VGLLLAGLDCSAAQALPSNTNPLSSKEACVLTLNIKAQQSLLLEVRGLGVRIPDFPESFEAKIPNAAKHRPLKVGGLGPGGEPTFWLDVNGTPFVDARVFGALQAVSIPRLSRPSTVKLGRVVFSPAPSPLSLARQLIEADVIGTYIHLESTLCLNEIPGGAHVTGTHTYVTHADHIEPVDFRVLIDAEGYITVSQQ